MAGLQLDMFRATKPANLSIIKHKQKEVSLGGSPDIPT